jgi:hypothetical protein
MVSLQLLKLTKYKGAVSLIQQFIIPVNNLFAQGIYFSFMRLCSSFTLL